MLFDFDWHQPLSVMPPFRLHSVVLMQVPFIPRLGCDSTSQRSLLPILCLFVFRALVVCAASYNTKLNI